MVKPMVMPKMRVCQRCKTEYIPNRSWQRFCTDECQYIEYNEKNNIPGRLRKERKQKREARTA
jgi:hypothetical protein